MARPSDYRYDPFVDTAAYVTLTERHLIPDISPYIVTLCEVPEKSAPSTTTAKFITISGGAVSYGETLIEVAAVPASGQYYPDYRSNAGANPEWNTGQILFSAADAGKMIEVTYSAKGTLTGITSNTYPSWFSDRGDGSDGDFYPTTSVTLRGRKNYRSVYIPAGVNITAGGVLDIRCQGFFICEGTIDASGGGGRGGVAVPKELGNVGYLTQGRQGAPALGAGAGGSAGSIGSSGIYIGGIYAGVMTDDLIDACVADGLICAGGGGNSSGSINDDDPEGYNPATGATGGNGGGFIRIVAKSHRNTGAYIARGSSGSAANVGIADPYFGASAGGGGGAIVVVAERIESTGAVDVSGGTGGTQSSWGAPVTAPGGQSGWSRFIELGVG